MHFRNLILPVFSALMLLITTGCEETTEETPTGPNSGLAGARVDSANQILENVLMDLINGDAPERPDDIDFTRPYNAYLRALEADPNHAGANFGAAILEVLMVTQDGTIQEFFDRAQAFLEDLDPFVAGGTTSAGLNGNPLELRIDRIALPVGMSIGKTKKLSSFDADPTFAELQDILVNRVASRMETAITRLNRVLNTPSFTFIVTPRMMGDPLEDPVELDLTEVNAMIVSLNVMNAIIYDIASYSMDFNDYTGNGLLAALTPGSPFMALHNTGAERMRKAGQAMQAAVNSIENGVNFLEAETDDQRNDLIKIDPYDGITRDVLDSIKTYIPRVRRLLTSSETINVEMPSGNSEDITISLAAYYNSPIADFKAMLPPYDVSLETVEADWDNIWKDSSFTLMIYVDTEDYYNWSRWAEWEDGELLGYNQDMNIYVQELEDIWNSMEGWLRTKSYASLSMNFWNYMTPGTNPVQVYLHYSYEEPTKLRYAPRITWRANSFAEWIFPDPTMNGMFPGMTDARMKNMFDMNANDWEKSILINFWDFESDRPGRPPLP